MCNKLIRESEYNMKKILVVIILIVSVCIVSCDNIDIGIDEDIDATFGTPNILSSNENMISEQQTALPTVEYESDIADIIPEPEDITEEMQYIEENTIESIEENIEDIVLLPKDVPILMYHTSSENNPGGLAELYVKPSEFEKQLQYLIEAGFTFCTFDDYYRLNNIDKPIFLTFDDGYLENYTEIFPVLQKYNAKITLFLILSSITPSNLTQEMIVEMSDSGLVKFESHTLTHPSLVQISGNDKRLTDELQDSKIKIEEITGKKVLALSYPNGEFNDIVKEKAKEFYSFGLRKDLNMHNTEYDNFEVRRIRINRSTNIETYAKIIEN